MISHDAANRYNVKIIDSSKKYEKSKNDLIYKLKSILPDVIDGDNRISIAALQDVIDLSKTTSNAQGYELMFAGKGLAKAEADAPPPPEN